MADREFNPLLQAAETRNGSCLCIGLDPDPKRFPYSWTGDPTQIDRFCASIVDATADLVSAYKPQIAYFSANRAEHQLGQVMQYIRSKAAGIPIILDAKRGDIGSTAEQYAREAFERYQADAVTLSPYLGYDSIEPYLRYDDKGLFLLCRTSNPGGNELQSLRLESGELLYEHVARLAAGSWARDTRVGLVVGATYPAELQRVRELAPHTPLLIPGYGAQGATAADAMAAWRCPGSIVVNSSRGILYPNLNPGEDYFDGVRRVAMAARDELNAARPNLATA